MRSIKEIREEIEECFHIICIEGGLVQDNFKNPNGDMEKVYVWDWDNIKTDWTEEREKQINELWESLTFLEWNKENYFYLESN